MGYIACIMDTKRVNESPVPMHNQMESRGQMSLKSSPFCPRSSSRLTQYIVQDHMVAHYKKVYSAKAAIDASVPKSMLHSVKYHDQLRRDQLRRDGSRSEKRPQSAHSLSQRSSRAGTRASCVSDTARGRRSVQGQESAYFCHESSMISGARLNTSFHAKQTVYPAHTVVRPRSPSHPVYSASEFSYRSPNSQRQHSARSGTATSTQSGYKSFQDPVQKTYSGDLLQKHAHHFTEDKAFTPRTLKSDGRSYLSQYRYYTPPRRKTAQDSASTRLTRQETYHGSTRAHQEYSSTELDDPPQGFCAERDWSDEDSHGFNHSAFGHQSKGIKSRSSDHHLSSYRVSPEGMKSPILKRVSAEEDELMYLEFIADVTNEILSRGLYSDRILERVFERHIEMNKLRLDEDRMRHLLEVLRNDLQSPASALNCSAEPKGSEENLFYHLQIPDTEVTIDTKEDPDRFYYASFNKGGHEELERLVPLSVSTPLRSLSPEGTAASPSEDAAPELKQLVPLPVSTPVRSISPERTAAFPFEDATQELEKLVPSPVSTPLRSISPEGTAASPSEDATQEHYEQHNHREKHGSPLDENVHHSVTNGEEDLNQNPADNHDDEVSRGLEELARNIAESLCVTTHACSDSQGVTELVNTVASLSDDEF